MNFETLRFEEKAKVGIVTINRPEAMNALNSKVLSELNEFARAHQSTSLRALIITGAGEKAFVAGADIKEMMTMTVDEAAAFAKRGQAAFSLIESIACPVIAAVNGFALGGGMELALACDVILASEKAKFGLPEVTLGLLPAFGGTQRLARSVGLFRAREMIFSGEFYPASEMEKMGLVAKVCPAAELMPASEKMAQTIASRSPVATAAAKRAIHEGFNRLLEEGLAIEARGFAKLFATTDQKEGTKAFVEKRTPQFTGT